MAVRKLGIPVIAIEPECGWRDSKWRIPWFATDNEAIGRLAEFLEQYRQRRSVRGKVFSLGGRTQAARA